MLASDWLVPVHLFFFFFVTNSASCCLMYISFAINCYLQLMEFYERVSGARMHAAYVRPGGVSQVRSSPHTHKQPAKRSLSSGTFALNISGLGIPCCFLQGLGHLGVIWMPKPSNFTPQDTQKILWEMIKYFHLKGIPSLKVFYATSPQSPSQMPTFHNMLTTLTSPSFFITPDSC